MKRLSLGTAALVLGLAIPAHSALNTSNFDLVLPLEYFPLLEVGFDGSAILTTNMVGNQGFQIISPAGTLTGTASNLGGFFVTNTVQEASTLFFQIPDVLDLGMLVADVPGFIADLASGNVTFHVANATATGFVEGNVLLPGVSFPATTFIGTVGSWFDPTQWSNGVPDALTNAYIDNGGFVQAFHGSITSRRLFIGSSQDSSGTMQQIGGSYVVVESLNLAGGSNSEATYMLEGGTLAAEQSNIGILGSAVFDHDAGSHSVTDQFSMGIEAGSSAVYTLTSGELTVGGDARIGVEGSAVFDLLAGELTVGGNLSIGSQGVLTQTGGSVSAGSMSVVGNYVHEAGSVDVAGHLAIAESGTLVHMLDPLSAGSMDVLGEYTVWFASTEVAGPMAIGNSGSLVQNGGSLAAGSANVDGLMAFYESSVSFSGDVSVLSNGTWIQRNGIASAASIDVLGQFQMQSGELEVAAGLSVGSSGVLTQSAGSLQAFGIAVAGEYETSGGLVVANELAAEGNGRIMLAGADVIAGSVSLGDTSELHISAGSLQADSLAMSSSATLRINGGRTTISGPVTLADETHIGQSGGELSTGSFGLSGRLGRHAGQMTVDGDMFVGGHFEQAGGELTISGRLDVADFSLLKLFGGTISAGSVDIALGSNVALAGGTLETAAYYLAGTSSQITTVSGSGQLAGSFEAERHTLIEAQGGVLTIGNSADWQGFATEGAIMIHANGELALASRGVSVLGRTTTLDGGTLSSANGIFLPAGALLTGHGVINSRIETAGGSMLVLNFDLEAGDASAVDGFAADGRIFVGEHTLTLRDQNRAGLGLLTELGDGGQAGTLVADNGLDIAFGRDLTGYGTVVTPNDPFAAVVNNGSITGDSIFQPITMTGYVKGVGQFDKVAFTGTFSPGLSPAVVYVGDLIFTESSVTIMELAGTAFGEYDRLISSGTLLLGGTLQVELLGGFIPVEGDVFELFTGNLVGGFSQIILPQLSEGLFWDTSLINTAGTLSVIPEPASLSILALGGLALLRRRVG